MKKKLLIVTGVLAILVIVAVVGAGLSLGGIIKRGVEKYGPGITKTEVRLDGASLSLLGGSGSIKGFVLGNPEGFRTASAIRAGFVSVGVRPKSLFAEKVHVRHVRVEAPEITFEGTLGTGNNLSRILENVKAATGADQPAQRAPAESKGSARKLQVDEFTITGARVNLSMTLFAGKSVTVRIPDIHLTDLGQGPEGVTAAELTQRVLGRLTAEVLQAVEKAVADLTRGATETLKNTAEGALKKATGIGDRLKKK